MIIKLFQIALTSVALNASQLLAISFPLLDYDDAALAQAIFEDDDTLALELIKHKPCDYHYTLNFIDSYWRHPLLDAIAEGNVQKVAAILKDNIPLNVVKQSVMRLTLQGINLMEEEGALQVAMKYAPNSYEMVKFLLDAGMDPNESYRYEYRQRGNEEGNLESVIETPLSLANRYKKFQLINLLLNPVLESHQEYSENEIGYLSDVFDLYYRHPLIDALKKGKLDFVQEMIKKGVDLNDISQGVIREYGHSHSDIFEQESALQIAIKYAPNAYEAVKLLLDNGLNPHSNFKYILREEYLKSDPQFSYIDPINLAIDCQKPDVVELLNQYRVLH
jgi:hypothetical protein